MFRDPPKQVCQCLLSSVHRQTLIAAALPQVWLKPDAVEVKLSTIGAPTDHFQHGEGGTLILSMKRVVSCVRGQVGRTPFLLSSPHSVCDVWSYVPPSRSMYYFSQYRSMLRWCPRIPHDCCHLHLLAAPSERRKALAETVRHASHGVAYTQASDAHVGAILSEFSYSPRVQSVERKWRGSGWPLFAVHWLDLDGVEICWQLQVGPGGRVWQGVQEFSVGGGGWSAAAR